MRRDRLTVWNQTAEIDDPVDARLLGCAGEVVGGATVEIGEAAAVRARGMSHRMDQVVGGLAALEGLAQALGVDHVPGRHLHRLTRKARGIAGERADLAPVGDQTPHQTPADIARSSGE